MNPIFQIAWNDLKRDAKRPWAMLLLAALPLGLSLLISAVFGGGNGKSAPMPTINVAVLDFDNDLLSHAVRSFANQGDGSKHLRLHFVDTREEGLRLVENRKASALLVLPERMTENLLEGTTNAIELYENPAEQVLPKVVREGTSLVAAGLSGVAQIAGEPLREFRAMIRSNDFPAELLVGSAATNTLQKLRGVRTYLFPPLVQFTNVAAADFEPYPTVPATNSNTATPASP